MEKQMARITAEERGKEEAGGLRLQHLNRLQAPKFAWSCPYQQQCDMLELVLINRELL